MTTILPDAEATVWVLTGNDELDDPTYGTVPLFSGSWGEVRDWLSAQPSLDGMSVTIGERCFWAADAPVL